MPVDFEAARQAVAQRLAQLYADDDASPRALPYGFDTGRSWMPMIEWDGVMGVYAYAVDKRTGQLQPLNFDDLDDVPQLVRVGRWPVPAAA